MSNEVNYGIIASDQRWIEMQQHGYDITTDYDFARFGRLTVRCIKNQVKVAEISVMHNGERRDMQQLLDSIGQTLLDYVWQVFTDANKGYEDFNWRDDPSR